MIKRSAGMTLIELLIGMLATSIVLSSIALGTRTGIGLFSKSMAHSRVITGVRFTIDSFNDKISPKLNIANNIQVLNMPDVNSIPDASELESDEQYIFLRGGSLIYRTSSGDVSLAGSECVASLDFYLPLFSSVQDDVLRYMLKIKLNGQHPEEHTVKLDAILEKALFNEFSRTGSSSSGSGNVLYFTSSSYLKILNALDKTSLAGKTLWSNTPILADYLLSENEDDIFWAVSKTEDAPTQLVEDLLTPGYLKLYTVSGDVIERDIINSHPPDGRYVRVIMSKNPIKFEADTYYLRYSVSGRWSESVKINPNEGASIGRPYKAVDTEIFTGSGPDSSIHMQKEYMEQVIGDVRDAFDDAKTAWQEHAGIQATYQAKNLEYQSGAEMNFASFVVDSLSGFNFSEFIDEAEFFTVGIDSSNELISISLKVGSYYYVIYENGHIYHVTENLVLGEQEDEGHYIYAENTAKWKMMNDETFFTETWKDFQGMPPGRTDFLYRESLKNHNKIGWSRLDLMLLAPDDLNHEYFTCREYDSSRNYDYGDIAFDPHDNMIYRRVRPSPSLKVQPHYVGEMIWQAVTYVSDKVVMPDGTIKVPREVIPYFSARSRFFALGTIVKGSNGKTYMYAPSNNSVALHSWPTGGILDRNRWVEVTTDIVKPDFSESKYPSGEDEGEASNAGVAGNVNRPKKGRYYAHDGYLHLSTYDSNSLIQSLTQHPEFIPILNNKYKDSTFYDQGAIVWYEGKLYKALLSFYAENKASNRPIEGAQTQFWAPYSRNLFPE